MQAAYAAAKAANPTLTIVGPGLADGGGNSVDPRTFLTQMYASGCRTAVCWDVLSVHPYAWIDPTYTVSSMLSTRLQIDKDLHLRDETVDGVVWTSLYNFGADYWSRTAVTDAAFNPLLALSAFRAFAVP